LATESSVLGGRNRQGRRRRSLHRCSLSLPWFKVEEGRVSRPRLIGKSEEEPEKGRRIILDTVFFWVKNNVQISSLYF